WPARMLWQWRRMTLSSPPCNAFWRKRSSTSPSSRATGSSASAHGRTSFAPVAASSSTNAPSRGGDLGSAPPSGHNEHDLAELAALIEALVSGRRVCEGVGRLDENAHCPTGERRDGVSLRSSRDQRLLLQRPGPEG